MAQAQLKLIVSQTDGCGTEYHENARVIGERHMILTSREVHKQTTALVSHLQGRAYINFAVNKTDLRPEESFKLGRMCQVLKENPSAKVVLTGYADTATGTPAINSELAARRAATVAAKLRDEGIDPNRISYTSEEGDWNKSASPEANRRVTVRIVNE